MYKRVQAGVDGIVPTPSWLTAMRSASELYTHIIISLRPTFKCSTCLRYTMRESAEGGIRTHVSLQTNGFQDRLVMASSIPLRMKFYKISSKSSFSTTIWSFVLKTYYFQAENLTFQDNILHRWRCMFTLSFEQQLSTTPVSVATGKLLLKDFISFISLHSVLRTSQLAGCQSCNYSYFFTFHLASSMCVHIAER